MQNKQIKNSDQLVFRRYSRKGFAAFNSLGKTIKISTLGVACTLIACPVQASSKSETDTISTKVDLEEVEVVGQKSTLLIDELPRMVETFDAQNISLAPAQSFQDLIEYGSNIDISQRGGFGIQSDVSIRGGSFDQVLILQNGINLTDPQTGHLSFNLPIDHESIYKIEILNGAASRALGANAYSGAINVITRPKNDNEVSASLNAGENGYFRGHLSINQTTKTTKHLISASYSKSDGYIKNTDFKAANLFYHGEYTLSESVIANVQIGINDKGFGANSFYTPKYQDQYEENTTYFFSAGVKSGKLVKNNTQVYWRRHKDRYELFRNHEDYYRYEADGSVISNDTNFTSQKVGFIYVNHHLTDIVGVNHTSNIKNAFGTTSLGASVRSENILSTSLGNELAIPIPIEGYDVEYTNQDSRNSLDLYAEHAYQGRLLFISGGALLHWNSFDPQKLNFIPGIDVSITPVENISFVGSYNYAVGHPTFTDLGYQGPANEGSKLLRPYTQQSIEAGVKYHTKKLFANVVGFYTQGENNIDWVLDNSNPDKPNYKATNVAYSENMGIETSLRYKNQGEGIMAALLSEIYVGYTFIDTYRSNTDSVSKYSNVRHKAVVRLNQNIFKGLTLSWNAMYKQREGTYTTYSFTEETYGLAAYPEALLIDLRVNYKVQNFTVYVEATNLLDKYYIESGSAPQPGRWFKAGINYRFKY